MSKPVVFDNKPVEVRLEAGTEYHFCRCGLSANQPFCDGSHVGSGLSPQAFTANERGDAVLCQCKHSANAPYCDGTHKTIQLDHPAEGGSEG